MNEVLISVVVAGIGLSGTLSGYVLSAKRADFIAASAAAQNLARERLEQLKAAEWNLDAEATVDQLLPLNSTTLAQPLKLPSLAGNLVTGLVNTVVTTIGNNPPLRMIRVDCVWTHNNVQYTNTAFTIRGPSQ